MNTVSTKLLNRILVFNIDDNKINIFWAANLHIIMISEGSCDTEDWNNDAENSIYSIKEKKNMLNWNVYF